MAFCRNCGNEYGEGAVVCTKCGCALGSVNQTKNKANSKSTSINIVCNTLFVVFAIMAVIMLLRLLLENFPYFFNIVGDYYYYDFPHILYSLCIHVIYPILT